MIKYGSLSKKAITQLYNNIRQDDLLDFTNDTYEILDNIKPGNIKDLCSKEDFLNEEVFSFVIDKLQYNPISLKVQFLLGQMAKYKYNFNVELTGVESLSERNEIIANIIQQELKMLLEQTIAAAQENAPIPEIPDLKKSLVDIQTERQKTANNIIRFCQTKEDVYSKFMDLRFHNIVSGISCTYIKILDELPRIMVCDPRRLVFAPGDIKMPFEDRDWCYYREPSTYHELMKCKFLSKSTKDRIETIIGSDTRAKKWDFTTHSNVTKNKKNLVFEKVSEKEVYQDLVHFEFKCLRSIYYLTYVNEEGREVSEMVDHNYPIPFDDAQKFVYKGFGGNTYCEYSWIDDLGNSRIAKELEIEVVIYAVIYEGQCEYYEERPQLYNLDDARYSSKLGFCGRIVTLGSKRLISLVDSMSFYYYVWVSLIYQFIKSLSSNNGYVYRLYLQNIPNFGELAKANSDTSVPELGGETKNFTAYMRMLSKGFSLENDKSSYGDTSRNNNRLENMSTIQDASMIWDLLSRLNQAISEAIGSNPYIEAQSGTQYANQETTRAALASSQNHWVALDAAYYSTVEATFNIYVNTFLALAQYAPYEETYRYLTLNLDSQAFVLSKEFSNELVGIKIEGTGNLQNYITELKQALPFIMQNMDYADGILEIIGGVYKNKTPEQISAEVQAILEKVRESRDVMQQSAMQLEQMKFEKEVKLQTLKNEGDAMSAIIMGYMNFAKDIDGNGIADYFKEISILRQMLQGDAKSEELAEQHNKVVNKLNQVYEPNR